MKYPTLSKKDENLLRQTIRCENSTIDLTGLLGDCQANRTVYHGLRDLFANDTYGTIVAPQHSLSLTFAQPIAVNFSKRLVCPAVFQDPPPSISGIGCSYQSEQGQIKFAVLPTDSLADGERVLIISSILARGSMVDAIRRVVVDCGAEVVGIASILSLEYLHPERVTFPQGLAVHSLLQYQEQPLS